MTACSAPMPADWGRAEWLQWRRQGIGASDVASVCGLSTFGSPLAVYYDKLELAPEQAESEVMRWGRLLEAPIAAEFTERTGLHVISPQLLVFDDKNLHRRATLDGLVVESPNSYPTAALGTIEIKTTRDRTWEDGIPDRVQIQVQWQLGVAGLTHAWLAVLHGGQRLDIYELDFDPLVFERLCTITDRFWTQHVLAENPPAVDSNPATTEALKGVFGERADGTSLLLDDDGLYWADEWRHAKDHLQNAEARVQLAENQLRATLGEATEGCDELGPLVTWRPQRKPASFDRKRFEQEHPELAAEYTGEPGTTRVLRATKALKERVVQEVHA